MNAIAFPIVAGPTAMPAPSSEGSRPHASSFGALVATAAKEQERQATESGDPEASDTTSDCPPAFVAAQQLSQSDAQPPNGLSSVLEKLSGDSAELALPPEDVLPDDETDAAVLPPTNQEAVESRGHSAKNPANADPVASKQGPPKLRVDQSEALSLAILAAPMETQQLTGSPASSALLNATDGSSSAPRPPSAIPANEAPTDEALATPSPSSERATDELNAADNQVKAIHTAGEPKSSRSARATEQLQAPALTNSSAPSPANTSPQTPDTITLPPTGSNASAIGETNAETPVKLVLATRAGQQTPEMETLALHIAARSARGDSRFTIRLDPPELGRIDVNLSLNSQGHAQAVLAVEKPQTLELLLRDAPTLERALKDAGLELGSNLSFSLKEEGRSQFARDEDPRPSRPIQLAPADAANSRTALNASVVEHLYGLRMARLDITV